MSSGSTARVKSLRETAREIARDFLQSVVVVDDRAAMGSEEPKAAQIEGRGFANSDSSVTTTDTRRAGRLSLTPPGEKTTDAVPDQALDAKALIDGFADVGLVCAVIRPTPSDQSVGRTVLAAARADIVILDWELNGDDGATTLEIIRQLVAQDGEGHTLTRLRLIAIYSGEVALRDIAGRIRDNLREHGVKPLRKTGPFTVQTGQGRIVVYSKPTSRLGRRQTGLRALQNRIVHPSKLPERLIDEFARLTTGLVPNVALASLAAVRKNTHRILAKMRADLDPAYLWHRATQTRPSDAEDHLVSLVADEISAVIEDERVGKWADLEAIRRWVADDGTTDYANRFNETTPRGAEDVVALLEVGTAGKDPACEKAKAKFRKMGNVRVDIAAFAKSPKKAAKSNQNFAALLSLRTRYENPPPRLELGTVLAHGRGSSRKYWLCVQPRCDSVRLKGAVAFPLVPLQRVEDGEWDLLLPVQEGAYHKFRIGKKPSDLWSVVFPIHPEGGDSVTAQRDSRGYHFRAHSNARYDWIVELKSDHAQRIAQELGNMFTRVGLTESEWARRWAPKAR